MENLAEEWNKKVSITAYSTNPGEYGTLQPGYYFNFIKLSNAPQLDAPPQLDEPPPSDASQTDAPLTDAHNKYYNNEHNYYNHIHVISVKKINNYYCVMFTLKVNGKPFRLNNDTIKNIFDITKDITDIKDISKKINEYFSYQDKKSIVNIAPDIKDKKNLPQYIYETNLEDCIKKLKIHSIICEKYITRIVKTRKSKI